MPFDILAVALRTRAATVGALSAIVERDATTVRAELARLDELGLVRLDGDTIHYLGPEVALGHAGRAQLNRLRTELGDRMAELDDLFGWLPTLIRQWEDYGPAADHYLRAEVYHGAEAVRHVWPLDPHATAGSIDIVLPDSSRFYVADSDAQAGWHEAITRNRLRVRVIGAVADVGHAAAQERIGRELAAGIQARMLPAPPSWFWIMGGETVALPLSWGQAWPTSVVVVHSATVAGLLSWVFDQLWTTAVPLRIPDSGWDAILQLLLGGSTIESAAHALGVSTRTGRRRVAEAMEHYGVDTLFALGAAWGQSRTGPDHWAAADPTAAQ